MQGYQPAARRLAQLPDKPQHLADGGAVGFGARGLAGLRQMIPLVQAMGYPQQQAAAPAPAPAPVADTRTAQLQAMIPRMEAMGFKQQPQRPQYLARGGMVRGPGTGTSDSIPDEAEPGTFIMPADSTEAIGPSALEKMGTVPVRLSDGEFKLPPEQVMAIGEAVLKLMKDATHAPVNGVDGGQTDAEVPEARGFAPGAAKRMAEMPEQLYADGGVVEPLRRPSSFGDAAAAASDPGVTRVRTSAADTFGRPPVPAPAAPAPSAPTAATRLGTFNDPRSTAYDTNPFATANAQKLAAVGQSSRSIVEAGMPPAPAPATARNSFGDTAAATRDASVTQVASGFQPGRGTVSTVPAQPLSARATTPAAAPQPAAGFQTEAQRLAAPAPAAPMGWQARQDQRSQEVSAASITNRPEWDRSTGFQPRRYADGGMVEDDLQKRLAQIPAGGPAGWTGGGVAPAPAPVLSAVAAAPAPVLAPAPAGALSRAAAMTPPAPVPAVQAMSAVPASLSGGEVSTQNMDAAQGLARRGAADAMASMPNAPAPVQAPTIRHSGNDWQSRNDLRNLEVSAKSITADGGRFDRNKGESPEALAYRAALGTDAALRASAPALAQQAMKEQGDLQRTALMNEGARERTAMQEQGLNMRAVIEARRSGQAPAGYQWTSSGGLTHIPGGPADPTVRGNKAPLNDVQSKALQFGTRMQAAGSVLDGLAAKGVDQPGLIKRAADAVGLGSAANWTQSGEQQQVEQAQRDFINAVLRRESGAAIADSEFANARQQYFPQVGDSPEVIAQKRKNREIATAGVLAEVPDSEKRVSQVLNSANANSASGPEAAAATGAPVQVTDAASYQALPSGATYITPTGEVRRKK